MPVKVTWTGPARHLGADPHGHHPANLPRAPSAPASVPGLNIPTTAITKSSTLKVEAGPVPGEKVLSNNHATFTIVPVLK